MKIPWSRLFDHCAARTAYGERCDLRRSHPHQWHAAERGMYWVRWREDTRAAPDYEGELT